MTARRVAVAVLSALVLVLGPACSRSAPQGDGVRLDLTLARGWSIDPDPKPPWVAPARMPHVTLETTVTLPAERIGAGSVLILQDVSWSAQVTINGNALPPQVGGLTPIEVPVGPHLKAGANQLRIVVTGPAGVSPLLSGQNGRRARLGEPPVLSLRPATHVDQAWVRLVGNDAVAAARVTGAPEGSTVHFSAVLDGQELQELGRAAIIGGVATADGVPWKGPRWTLGLTEGPALFQLTAVLVGPDGDLLDRSTTRTGLRDFQVVDRRFQLNGEPIRLLGQRVTDHTSLAVVAKLTAAAGHNVVEFHGRLPSPTELDQADERGLAAVVLPRCPGILSWRRLSTADRAPGPCVLPDEQLAQSLAAHPSVLLWILEEGPGGPDQAREGLLTDPLQRPIVGHHLPGQALVVDGPGAGRDPSMFSGHWITEMGSRREHAQDPRALPNLLLATLKAGAMGGIVHGPARGQDRAWAQVWQELLVDRGVPPWTAGPTRARSHVTVQGLAPGAVAWLEVDGLTAVGATASRDGIARLELWHQGAGTLHAGGHSQPVQLTPGQWTDAGWTGDPTTVTVP